MERPVPAVARAARRRTPMERQCQRARRTRLSRWRQQPRSGGMGSLGAGTGIKRLHMRCQCCPSSTSGTDTGLVGLECYPRQAQSAECKLCVTATLSSPSSQCCQIIGSQAVRGAEGCRGRCQGRYPEERQPGQSQGVSCLAVVSFQGRLACTLTPLLDHGQA